MTRLGKQVEAYRQARCIVRACNRMKAGQGVALQWCTEQRHVLRWMMRNVADGLLQRKAKREQMKRAAIGLARLHHMKTEAELYSSLGACSPTVRGAAFAALGFQTASTLAFLSVAASLILW